MQGLVGLDFEDKCSVLAPHPRAAMQSAVMQLPQPTKTGTSHVEYAYVCDTSLQLLISGISVQM
jgi:hypothetical protein